MNIRLSTKDPLVNATYKVPHTLKAEIDAIAKAENLTQGEVVRGFLDYALEAYHAGNVQRIWGETMMSHFRNQIKIGDAIVAAGLSGIVKGLEDSFFRVEIADGVEVKILKNELSDIINPSKKLLEEMKKYHQRIGDRMEFAK